MSKIEKYGGEASKRVLEGPGARSNDYPETLYENVGRMK
jgi:hypothetical protein